MTTFGVKWRAYHPSVVLFIENIASPASDPMPKIVLPTA